MKNINDYNKVFNELNINKSKAVSIYKYSPVFKFMEDGKHFILKKTKKEEERVSKLFQYEKLLQSNNISVVSPVTRRGKDFVRIDDESWVVYPFYSGSPYNGSIEHIKQAGELLGKIHSVSNNTFNHGFSWNSYNQEFMNELSDDFKNIKEKYGIPELNISLEDIESAVLYATETNFNDLKEQTLPMVDGIWDYKGNNLVFNDEMVTLIDPDNAGFIPRIFDLALTLILFNTESTLAPERVFTLEEWNIFMQAYLKYIEITDEEKNVWVNYLKFVFVDEALWAITDLDENESDRQKNFIKSLLSFDFNLYKI